MPIYERDGAWVVVVHHRGKRLDRRFEGKKADAEAYEARLRTRMEQGDPVLDPRNVPTFSDFCVQTYGPHAELRLKAKTWEKKRHQLANLNEFFARVRLNRIDAAQVDRFASQRKSDGVSPVTINNELRALKRVLNFARDPRTRHVPVEHGMPEGRGDRAGLGERGHETRLRPDPTGERVVP